MDKVIVVTGASSGFGALTVRRLALAGHAVYAGMRETSGRNLAAVADLDAFGSDNKADVHAVELDVQSQESADAAIESIIREQGRLDVVVHNAGHMVTGPAEAFTPEQYADLYDVNVLGTQRVNRAALPHLRGQRSGHVVWVGSSSTRGGTPPYLAPYFAAKAAMDAVAVSYRAELLRFGIETTIVVPGAFTHGTNHFAHSGTPADTSRASEYEELYPGLMDQVGGRLAELEPSWADAGAVADAIVDVVGAAKPPFRVHVDPSSDGAEVVNAVADRVRGEFLRRVELADLI
ncbi:SDR family oxidoreductase [Lentzea flaviverrucosa]|uniref:NADP-dependent 3-hydroxy acid dehydrogenase YdfG n=1 Tax=Lentzea flaviverrucosa TaxID=200379 RepID=A0A1H9FRQ3_9PSEU|nr:SDR family oxidoreductase [Lentzea flaviverrucosa]RDI35122.1 NADP-dependent 3-hydroxy acid dehydrogenase YdfG [Lentzea flaviverrucosa]SEQ40602.1 NADP-dependent 3-hydroxy acid dehydrogenase YdfG [Lentzea flaviverrucosa]